MKRQNKFSSLICSFVHSNGLLFFSKSSCKYFFPFSKDIFNSEIWLKKKSIVVENRRLLQFKAKFSKKL